MVNLGHPQDRANSRQQPQKEYTTEYQHLLEVDTEPQQERNGEDEDDNVEAHGHDRKAVEQRRIR